MIRVLSLFITSAIVSSCATPAEDVTTDPDPVTPDVVDPSCEALAGAETGDRCGDSCDNDGDGAIDCDDSECAGVAGCGALACADTGPEDSQTACENGCDDDGDGFADCDDRDCQGTSYCTLESSNLGCHDGIDNDGDGHTDCEDFDCTGFIVCSGEETNATCADGIDNDGDGNADCDDDDCEVDGIVVCGTSPVTNESDWAAAIETSCTNGVQDQGPADGFVDCASRSCWFEHAACRDLPREGTNELCSDGLDNDKDGLIDCADTGCQGAENMVVCVLNGDTWEAATTNNDAAAANARCGNNTNDDESERNTYTDCDDFACQGDPWVTVCDVENTDALCTGGVDDDGDGFVDCGDYSCNQSLAVTVCSAEREYSASECSDGLDDNGNGYVDCFDASCCGSVTNDRSECSNWACLWRSTR